MEPRQPPPAIAIATRRFYPLVGGSETVTWLISRELARLGCQVKVVAHNRHKGPEPEHCQVVRHPGIIGWYRQLAGVDGVIFICPALIFLWPLLFRRIPALITHHAVYSRSAAGDVLKNLCRRPLYKMARHAVPSQAVAETVAAESVIAGNPYDDELFRELPGMERSIELVFLGRLIPEKGAMLLLEALALLRQRGLRPRSTVAGEGPDRRQLERRASELGVADQVHFAGRVTGPSLAQLLNRHRLLVVPSLCREAFGIVVLEAMACGCVPLVANHGGLPEAAGPAGEVFRPGDTVELADKIAKLLTAPEEGDRYRALARAHLRNYEARSIAVKYLSLLGLDQRARSRCS